MEAATSAISLVDASLILLSNLQGFYDKIPDGVMSIRGHLQYIEEVIRTRSCRADREGGVSSCWISDLRRLKLRIEDVLELYNSVFTGNDTRRSRGPLALIEGTSKRMSSAAGIITECLKEIADLSSAVRDMVQTYNPPLEPACETPRSFHHDNEPDPLGLKTPIQELVEMLNMSDVTRLRVVGVWIPHSCGKDNLAKSAFEQAVAKGEFTCNAWVTASHDDDGEGLLKAILGQLDQRQQTELETLSQLREAVKDSLKNKRYIIGIDRLETTSYWDDVLSAFPDEHMSSRIIITTSQEVIAQTCNKNSPVYRMQSLDTQIIEAPGMDLIQILCEGKARNRRVVTISGPGGSGKSVLAKAAYNLVEEEFRYKAWVTTVSHDNDGKNLLLDILRQLGETGGLHDKNFIELTETLQRLLLSGRYIIVIDGLETTVYWNNVLSACPDNDKSNRIIVTTTSERVTNICRRDGPVYKMRPLDKCSAKALLERKVMSHGNVSSENLDACLTMILETCEYLPLAIANMGDYMRSLNEEWDYARCVNACTSIGSLFVSNEAFRGMNHVLNRSYTSLNDNAKACLLSLTICSDNLVIKDHAIEDHVIKGKPLIRRLLAERLISGTEGIANECFSALTEHNFIVPVKVSISGQVKTFRVNRMMPQFINGKGYNENYVTRIGTQNGEEVVSHTDISRLYIHNSSIAPPRIGQRVGVSHTRLITLHGKANKSLMDLNDYPFLRVLILENCENMKDKHLTTICSPRLLRYLSIRGNKDVSKLPNNIVKMRSLETLDTRGTKVRKIPMGVILLPKLLHLFGKFQIACVNKKSVINISKVQKLAKVTPNENPLSNSKLQTLAGLFLMDGNTDFLKLLPRMPMLSKVKILCPQTVSPDEKVKNDLLESLQSCFNKEVTSRNSPLYSLTVDFRCSHLNFLDKIAIEEPPCFLRSLKLCGNLTQLPRFILSLKDSLKELCLSETDLMGSVLSELKHVKSLQFLKITKAHFEFGELIFESYCFSNLQRLCFDVDEVPKIFIQKHSMKGLKSLQLICKELGGVSGILHLGQLKEVILSSRVSGVQIDDLVQQVREHSTKPKLLDADGSSWPILLSRRLAFRLEDEEGPEPEAEVPNRPMLV